MEKWNYRPRGEAFKETSLSLAAAATMAFGLTSTFNFMALGVAAVLPFVATKYISKVYNKSERKSFTNREWDENLLAPLYDFGILNYFENTKNKLGLSNARIFQDPRPGNRSSYVLPGPNYVGMSKYTLENCSPASIRFTVAHELAHLKAKDGKRSANFIKIAGGGTLAILLTGTAAVALASAAGIHFGHFVFRDSMPWQVALSNTWNTAMLSNLLLRASTRVVEKRADRNALYITKDLQGALEKFEDGKKSIASRILSVVEDWTSTHPSNATRCKNLKADWGNISPASKKISEGNFTNFNFSKLPNPTPL